MAPPCATSHPFVKTENLLLLARVAETWGCRPSELLGFDSGIQNLTPALQIDIAAAVALWRWKDGGEAEPGSHEEWW